MKDKPVAVSLAGPNRDDMGEKWLFSPIFRKRDGKNPALRSFFPDWT